MGAEAVQLAALIVDELTEQGGYCGVEITVDTDGVLAVDKGIIDGYFDLVRLAQRILDETLTDLEPVPGIVTDVPDGKSVIWTEYVHKKHMQNMNQRMGHFAKNNRTQAVKALGRARHPELGKFNRAKLDIIISYPARFSADVHNYMPTAKAYVDGLIDVPDAKRGEKKQPARGIMIDDSDAYLAGPFLHPGLSGTDKADHFRLDCILQPMKKN